jgi:hypothetical protein
MVVGLKKLIMNSKENACSIIKDKSFDKFAKIETKRTKNGYKVKYKKRNEFLEYDVDDYIVLFFFLLIITGGLTLTSMAVFTSIWVWCIVPVAILALLLFFMFNGKTTCFQDALVMFGCLIANLIIMWCILAGAYNNKFYGRKSHHYVIEKVNPDLLFFK